MWSLSFVCSDSWVLKENAMGSHEQRDDQNYIPSASVEKLTESRGSCWLFKSISSPWLALSLDTLAVFPRCATLPGTCWLFQVCNMLGRLYCLKNYAIGLKWNFFTFNNTLRYWSYSVHGKSFRPDSVYEHLSCPIILASPGFRQLVTGGSR